MQPPEMFFQRMKFKTATGEFDAVKNIKIDCFLFVFENLIDSRVQYDMFEYMQSIPIKTETAISKIMVWLYQHHVRVRLRFSWNTKRSIIGNLIRLPRPRRIQSIIEHNLDEVMSIDLASWV